MLRRGPSSDIKAFKLWGIHVWEEEVSQLSTLAKTGSKEIGLRSELILRALFVFGTASISAELGSDFL